MEERRQGRWREAGEVGTDVDLPAPQTPRESGGTEGRGVRLFCVCRASEGWVAYLHDYLAGQLGGAEELEDPSVGRHFLRALSVAVREEVAIVTLFRLAQRQTLHLTPPWPCPGIDPETGRGGGRGGKQGRLAPVAARGALRSARALRRSLTASAVAC